VNYEDFDSLEAQDRGSPKENDTKVRVSTAFDAQLKEAALCSPYKSVGDRITLTEPTVLPSLCVGPEQAIIDVVEQDVNLKAPQNQYISSCQELLKKWMHQKVN
jgi:hypothetical protein